MRSPGVTFSRPGATYEQRSVPIVPLPLPREIPLLWLLLLLTPLTGLWFAEAISAHVLMTASEIRCAIGGILLGLPIAPAIAFCEHRARTPGSQIRRRAG